MGKHTRARRAAKAKARATRPETGPTRSRASGPGDRPGWAPEDDEPSLTQVEQARQLLVGTAQAWNRGDRLASEGLVELRSLPVGAVSRAAERALLDQVDTIWAGGWQPAELLRQGRLGCRTAAGARLVGAAMATDHAGRRSVTLDHRWIAQVEGLGLPVVNGRPGWVERWIDEEGFDRATAVGTMVGVLAHLMRLPRLEPLLPPPGSRGAAAGRASKRRPDGPIGAESDPVLVRIRALLAQAESTTFEAEATTFTAKAHELMTRHAIDAAVLHDRSDHADESPVAIRVPIDAPYADAKSLLLQTVAEAGRCRSVFHVPLAMSTVVGFDADVAAVELLFTSLLLQAQTALGDAAKRAPAGTRPRSQSYRSAFLLAYTGRIGVRLDEINDAVFAEVEAEQGSAFLPVLRSRSAAVDDLMAQRFGDLVSSPVRRGYDPAGWASGTIAADNARISFGELADEDVPAS
jgi:hypothetical protein